jgi:hypothetical protein
VWTNSLAVLLVQIVGSADTEKNGTLASPATAQASRVLPVPGGPTISTPRGTAPR